VPDGDHDCFVSCYVRGNRHLPHKRLNGERPVPLYFLHVCEVGHCDDSQSSPLHRVPDRPLDSCFPALRVVCWIEPPWSRHRLLRYQLEQIWHF
jgi:hypothetical protein